MNFSWSFSLRCGSFNSVVRINITSTNIWQIGGLLKAYLAQPWSNCFRPQEIFSHSIWNSTLHLLIMRKRNHFDSYFGQVESNNPFSLDKTMNFGKIYFLAYIPWKYNFWLWQWDLLYTHTCLFPEEGIQLIQAYKLLFRWKLSVILI